VAVFLVAWTSVLALVGAFAVGRFILLPSRARLGSALGLVAVALAMLVLTAFWLRA
jgi:hypothetical protein